MTPSRPIGSVRFGTTVSEIVPIPREVSRAETVLAPRAQAASTARPARGTFFAKKSEKAKKYEPAPFVATWSARVPSGRESAWTPVAGGVNTPARRSVFVDELVGNIDKL